MCVCVCVYVCKYQTENIHTYMCLAGSDLCQGCADAGGYYCGDDQSTWTSYAPNGCVPSYYLNDGWADCVNGLDENGAVPTTTADCGGGYLYTWHTQPPYSHIYVYYISKETEQISLPSKRGPVSPRKQHIHTYEIWRGYGIAHSCLYPIYTYTGRDLSALFKLTI